MSSPLKEIRGNLVHASNELATRIQDMTLPDCSPIIYEGQKVEWLVTMHKVQVDLENALKLIAKTEADIRAVFKTNKS